MEETPLKTQPFPLLGKSRIGWILFWLLLILLVNALIVGMVGSIRGLDSSWMLPFGVLAVIIGWFFSGLFQVKHLLFIIGLLSGWLLIVLVNSGASANLHQAMVESLRLNILFYPTQHVIPETGLLFYYLYASIAYLESYLIEITRWMISFFQSQAGFNPHVIIIIWGSLYWGSLFTTGWLFRQKAHALTACLPVLILQTGVLGYSRQNTLGLVISLGCLLFLIVLIEHLKREIRWQLNKIDFSTELRFDIATLTVPVVLIILSIAAGIPNISIENIRNFYYERFQIKSHDPIEISDSLGLEQVPIEPYSNATLGGMPRNHLMGTGVELSEILVMTIDTGETFLPPQVDSDVTIPKYYWFGRSFDIYTGAGWKTSEIQEERISKDKIIKLAKSEYTRIISQTVRKTAQASPALYASGIPQSVNQPVTASWRQSTGEYFAGQLAALEYQVEAPVMQIHETDLSRANHHPPTEILESYLQLPDDIPERVRILAASLTSEAITPYEKAQAIENYLRQLEYTLDLPTLPPDRDIVDYFLFDLKQGYCDYFASAMVILARASGLPARIAVGYATGNYDYARQVFVVSEANAHAWPEVYIAPYGWIPFEPTASLATFNWETEVNGSFVFPELDLEQAPELVETSFWLKLLGFGTLLLVIFLTGFLYYWLTHKRQQPRSTILQIENVYQDMKSQLTQLFLNTQTATTPLEFRHDITHYLSKRASTRFSKQLASHILEDLETLITLYHQGVFSPNPLHPHKIKTARNNGRRLLVRSWILSVVFIFNRT